MIIVVQILLKNMYQVPHKSSISEKRPSVPAWHPSDSDCTWSHDIKSIKTHCGTFFARLDQKSCFGCRTISKGEKQQPEMRMVRQAMGVSLLECRRNEEILEEAKVRPIVMVIRMRRFEWFGQRRDQTENIKAVAKLKMEGSAL